MAVVTAAPALVRNRRVDRPRTERRGARRAGGSVADVIVPPAWGSRDRPSTFMPDHPTSSSVVHRARRPGPANRSDPWRVTRTYAYENAQLAWCVKSQE